MKVSALIFGYNDYALEIAKNILHKYTDITIFKMDSNNNHINDLEEFNIEKFDLSDDWSELSSKHKIEDSVAFCVLDDDAQNIFLTISLRAEFTNLTIIALSQNKESSNKLKMAGADKVIPLVQTTASIIKDMLDKPVVTSILHNILYEKSDLKVVEIEVKENNVFIGKHPSNIEWNKEHKVIVLSIKNSDGGNEFIYSSKAKHHMIKVGDVFVVVGYDKDIKEFEMLIGSDI